MRHRTTSDDYHLRIKTLPPTGVNQVWLCVCVYFFKLRVSDTESEKNNFSMVFIRFLDANYMKICLFCFIGRAKNLMVGKKLKLDIVDCAVWKHLKYIWYLVEKESQEWIIVLIIFYNYNTRHSLIKWPNGPLLAEFEGFFNIMSMKYRWNSLKCCQKLLRIIVVPQMIRADCSNIVFFRCCSLTDIAIIKILKRNGCKNEDLVVCFKNRLNLIIYIMIFFAFSVKYIINTVHVGFQSYNHEPKEGI